MSIRDDREDSEAAEPRKIDLVAGRRAFIQATGLAAASASVLGLTGFGSSASAQSAPTDVQVLNFALNLEYLEAEFYLKAAFGRGLNPSDTTGQGLAGEVLTGNQVQFTDPLVSSYAQEIANDEETHVKFLRSALGSAAVARPKLNLKGAFTKAAQAAGVIGPNDTFDAYANDVNFLLAAYIFEDVGVTAYHGAARILRDGGILAAAMGILAVEAYHAGIIRTVLFAKQTATPSLGIFKATRLISALRSSLAGSSNPDDQGISANESQIDGGNRTVSNLVPTDINSIAFERAPRQVLNIVYGQKDATMGLFFPNGVNAGP